MMLSAGTPGLQGQLELVLGARRRSSHLRCASRARLPASCSTSPYTRCRTQGTSHRTPPEAGRKFALNRDRDVTTTATRGHRGGRAPLHPSNCRRWLSSRDNSSGQPRCRIRFSNLQVSNSLVRSNNASATWRSVAGVCRSGEIYHADGRYWAAVAHRSPPRYPLFLRKSGRGRAHIRVRRAASTSRSTSSRSALGRRANSSEARRALRSATGSFERTARLDPPAQMVLLRPSRALGRYASGLSIRSDVDHVRPVGNRERHRRPKLLPDFPNREKGVPAHVCMTQPDIGRPYDQSPQPPPSVLAFDQSDGLQAQKRRLVELRGKVRYIRGTFGQGYDGAFRRESSQDRARLHLITGPSRPATPLTVFGTRLAIGRTIPFCGTVFHSMGWRSGRTVPIRGSQTRWRSSRVRRAGWAVCMPRRSSATARPSLWPTCCPRSRRPPCPPT